MEDPVTVNIHSPSNLNMRVVYVIRVFKNHRCIVPVDSLYYIKLEHALFSLEDCYTRLEVIYEPINSDIYKEAVVQSHESDNDEGCKKLDDKFKHLMIPLDKEVEDDIIEEHERKEYDEKQKEIEKEMKRIEKEKRKEKKAKGTS